MAFRFQEHLAYITRKQMNDLLVAFYRIPEDKRDWRPAEESRSAIDQMAEIALIHSGLAETLRTKEFSRSYGSDADFLAAKVELAKSWGAVKETLDRNMPKIIEGIRELTDEDLSVIVQLPWGPGTVAEDVGYPFWNMTYHEGQINYIASMLGCLD